MRPSFRLKDFLPFKGLVIAVNLLLFAVICLVTAMVVANSAHHREAAARTHVQAFMKAMDAHVANSFKEADLALQGFAAQVRKASPAERGNVDFLHRQLELSRPAQDSETWMIFVDTAGHGVATSNATTVTGINYADRDYYRAHAGEISQAGASGLFVGEPAIGKATGRRFVPASRKVVDAQGRFLGVAVVAIDVRQFAGTFENARFSRDDVISLVHRSGKMVARVPDFEKTFAMDVSYAGYFREYRAGKTSGTFESVSQIDQIRRLSAYQEVRGLPLVLAAGLPVAVVNDGLQQDLLVATAVVLVIGTILLVTGRSILGYHASLQKSEARFRQLYTAIRDGVGYVDMQGRLVDVNDEFIKLTGHAREELIGKPLRSLIPQKWHAQEDQVLQEQVYPRGFSEEFDKEYIRKDGSLIAVNVKIWLIRNEAGQPEMMAVVVRDVTKRRALAERVAFLAEHDALTGLVNRANLADRIENALALARRRGESVAVIFIDLDDFKCINDTHGHAAGDELLRGVAQILTGNLRASDTACRFGGDEFVVVLPDLSDPVEAWKVVEKIERAAVDGVAWNGKRLPLHFSYGIAVYPDDANDVQSLLQKADAAMYLSKSVRRMAAT